MKKLYICCNKKEKGRFMERAQEAFSGSLEIVNDLNNADLVYVVGEETPEIVKEIDSIKKQKIKFVRVNENFITEDIYKKMIYGKIKLPEREGEIFK